MDSILSFTTFDYVLSIIILIFAIAGLIRGFVDNIFGKLAVILGIISGFLFYEDAKNKLWTMIENQTLANIVGFLTVFVIVFLIIKIIQLVISKIFSLKILKSLDRVLGFVFGAVEGFAIVGLLIFFLNVQPFVNTEKLLEGSFYAKMTNQVMDTIQNETGGNHV